MTRGLVVFLVAVALPAVAVRSIAATGPAEVSLGSGAHEVWILRPVGAVRDIVVFGHGWSTPMPGDGFAAWIGHLRRGGSLVVYPRYRVGVGDSPSAALRAFHVGVIDALTHLEPIRVPILALGKSFGASAVFYYGAEATDWNVPGPTAIVSVFPAYPVGGLPARSLPRRTYVRILVGDADTTAGSGGADEFWRWLASHPAELKSYRVVRSRAGFVADHDSAQRSDPIARAVFWRPVDELIARLIQHHGHY